MRDSLRIAKHRFGRRRNQGGAAMFIVSMTLGVLASVGLYALAAASTEIKTSGNERQFTQTHYLSEYGVIGTAHVLAEGRASALLSLMLSPSYRDACGSLPLPPSVAAGDNSTRACRRLEDQELANFFGSAWASGAQVTVPYSTSTPPSPPYTATPGSFGATPMTGGFFVELTNPTQTDAARYALPGSSNGAHICFYQFTASATGVTNSGIASAALFGSEGVEVQRARIVAGPIPCVM
jgi:hypothetical protein